jgi:DNA-binding winged helix-turn-helix (wHTH) protein
MAFSPSDNPQRRFRVLDLVIDMDRQTVSRGKQLIDLPKLSYRLFAVLIARAPDAVSKDELIREVWDDVVVGDETLAQRVRLLRQALGENSQSPRYFESVRGRGYRLIFDAKPVSGMAARNWTSVVLVGVAGVAGFRLLCRWRGRPWICRSAGCG